MSQNDVKLTKLSIAQIENTEANNTPIEEHEGELDKGEVGES